MENISGKADVMEINELFGDSRLLFRNLERARDVGDPSPPPSPPLRGDVRDPEEARVSARSLFQREITRGVPGFSARIRLIYGNVCKYGYLHVDAGRVGTPDRNYYHDLFGEYQESVPARFSQATPRTRPRTDLIWARNRLMCEPADLRAPKLNRVPRQTREIHPPPPHWIVKGVGGDG